MIKLTLAKSTLGTHKFVNPDYIEAFYFINNPGNPRANSVIISARNGEATYVEELPEEILRLIDESNGVVKSQNYYYHVENNS